MTYTYTTDISGTKYLLETTEMKILRRISGRTLLDKVRSEKIRKSCKAEDMNEWVHRKAKNRMEQTEWRITD